jgi:rhodanese-related sulfurtransferase
MMPLSETGVFGPFATLVAAPIVGFAFGWFLERGGLANARKLAGQFYLTDLTVFKVMFSALLTAMLGAFWLDRLGVLDLDLVYIPETFVLPQALGGVLFGAGFLIGGLCPGTSCVAAASGRLDGLAVIGGMLLGVLAFNVTFDWIAPFYESTPLGQIRLTDAIGISRGAGVALVTAMALAGFMVASTINPQLPTPPPSRPEIQARFGETSPELVTRARQAAAGNSQRGRALALIAVVLAAAAVFADGSSTTPRFISAPDLASRIMRRDPGLRIFDLRSAAEFERFHVASAQQLSPFSLRHEPLPPNWTVVLYGNGESRAAQAWAIARDRGADAFVLRGGVREWFVRVYEPRLATDPTPTERAEFEQAARFSRFFGGKPVVDVPRNLLLAAATIRRRGC